jgi:uncharacterized protein YehS (DUF1456 family)
MAGKGFSEYINPKSIVAEAKMMRTKNKGQTYLLVEGETDIVFYRNLVDNAVCKIRYCRGKSSVLTAIKAVNQAGVRGVIAIVDLDFDTLLGKEILEENLFLTDTHDLESMALKSGTAFERFNNEYGNLAKIQKFEQQNDCTVFERITEACAMIGKARLSSMRYNLNLDFNDIPLQRYVDEHLEFQFYEYIRNAVRRSRDLRNKKEIVELIRKENNRGYEIWQVCRGHDLTEMIAIYYSKDKREASLGNQYAREINAKTVERALRLAYDMKEFHETELYRQLRQWQKENPDMIVLKKIQR